MTLTTAVISTFVLLIMTHAVVDFGLQNQFVADFKARKSGVDFWGWVLGAHCLMHGAGVFLVTQRIDLAIAETVAHGIIDHLKCEGKFGFHMDQFLHVVCKVIWTVLFFTT
jgi:uncharacterized membrane protein YhaH (DUF805 family)